MPPASVIFAGGGSGGHLSPGLAIAERLRELAPESQAIFVCSERAIDAAMLREAGVRFVPIPAAPPAVRPRAAMCFLRGWRASRRIVGQLISREGVSQVVALGGFVAAPAVAAARRADVPVMLVNLDAPPGKANRWMAKRCNEVLSAIALPTMPRFAARVVGMPIRRRALAPAPPHECRLRLSLQPNLKTLLITRASQGATSINEMMIELARQTHTAKQPRMNTDEHGSRYNHPDPCLSVFIRGSNPWQILHLAGHDADEPVRRAYEAAGIRASVLPFLNEMGLAWGAADLALSRAGASSVAEAAANAVPTLFLPYPYHKDMHQRHNAQPLVDMGGAVMEVDRIDPAANAEHAGSTLHALMNDDARREEMSRRLRANPPPNAAETIARMVLDARRT